MLKNVRTNAEATTLTNVATCGLGELEFHHPPGTFAVTPASLVSLRAIGSHQNILSGVGLDWGSGCGILAIAAARIEAVTRVTGLEIEPANVEVARRNARQNGVDEKTEFLHANSFSPFHAPNAAIVAALRGKVQFILANPPSSEQDDGFDFRRRVLRESQMFLVDKGVVFLSISSQYGRDRIAGLTSQSKIFRHRRVLATTDWAPFDLTRTDLLECLRAYVREEKRGGLKYEFMLPGELETGHVTAESAMAFYERTGESPLSKWQTHLFEFGQLSNR